MGYFNKSKDYWKTLLCPQRSKSSSPRYFSRPLSLLYIYSSWENPWLFASSRTKSIHLSKTTPSTIGMSKSLKGAKSTSKTMLVCGNLPRIYPRELKSKIANQKNGYRIHPLLPIIYPRLGQLDTSGCREWKSPLQLPKELSDFEARGIIVSRRKGIHCLHPTKRWWERGFVSRLLCSVQVIIEEFFKDNGSDCT